jgi:hypothetical protein
LRDPIKLLPEGFMQWGNHGCAHNGRENRCHKHDEPIPVRSLVTIRLLGVIEGEQTGFEVRGVHGPERATDLIKKGSKD